MTSLSFVLLSSVHLEMLWMSFFLVSSTVQTPFVALVSSAKDLTIELITSPSISLIRMRKISWRQSVRRAEIKIGKDKFKDLDAYGTLKELYSLIFDICKDHVPKRNETNIKSGTKV